MEWTRRLEQALASPETISFRQSQRARFSPELSYGRHFAPACPHAKSAAVLVLLQATNAKADWTDCAIPLTVRPLHLPDHPGQISFPGGRLEGRESYTAAAIREYEEELGVERFSGRILGQLLPIWVFNSNYWLVPILAVQVGATPIRPCKREVERVIQLPASTLLSVDDDRVYPFSRGVVHWSARAFRVEQDLIWGVTAIVLGELSALLKEL